MKTKTLIDQGERMTRAQRRHSRLSKIDLEVQTAYEEFRPPEQLGPDMMVLANTFHLDKNTQILLAYYDARTLEDFCLMTKVDFDTLLVSATLHNRPLPPLQIRKVQVLREWVQSLVDTKPVHIPAWIQTTSENPVEKANLIPSDWKRRFQQDLPKLKKLLKLKGDQECLATRSWMSYFLSIRFVLCGTP